MDSYLGLFIGYILAGNALLYLIINRYATDTVTIAAKSLISFSLFCGLSALVLLNIDVYQSLNNLVEFDLVNLWRFFYWCSFFFGYIVFVVLSEHDRVGGSSSLTGIWLNFYRERMPLFVSIVVSAVMVVLFMIYKNFISV
jgi:hypothetical protein